MTSPRVLAVQADDDTPLGLIGPRLAAAGIVVETWQARFDPPPAGPFDGMIVLGSVTDPDEDRFEPWIGGVRGEVSLALDLGIPLLGICFGAQIVTQQTGGAVARMDDAEIGWIEVVPTAEAADDPLMCALPQGGIELMSWHQFRIEPPEGAVRLVSATRCEQAWRLAGSDVWAVQFHFEADGVIAADWIDSDVEGLAARGLDAAALHAATARNADPARPVSDAIADGFARVVIANARR